jgi:hypothetical protein
MKTTYLFLNEQQATYIISRTSSHIYKRRFRRPVKEQAPYEETH